MANKNSKRLLAAARKSAKAGNSEYAVETPASGYHNTTKGCTKTRRIPNVKYAHKKKAKPFPKGSEELSLATQREIFYGKKS